MPQSKGLNGNLKTAYLPVGIANCIALSSTDFSLSVTYSYLLSTLYEF